MTIYLYKKTHNKTGLQYLGKTSRKDPHKYKGSGKYWKRHIKKHGYDVSTEILRECQTNEEVKEWGLYYSNLWDIVESVNWANFKPETGDGNDSETATALNLLRVKNGTHPFLGGELARQAQLQLVKNGKHNFLGGKQVKKQLQEGTHPWQGPANNLKRVQNGTNPFVGGTINKKMMESGNHPSQYKWSCPYCGKQGAGKGTYTRFHGTACKSYPKVSS